MQKIDHLMKKIDIMEEREERNKINQKHLSQVIGDIKFINHSRSSKVSK